MSKKRSQTRTTCGRCGGPFDSLRVTQIEFWSPEKRESGLNISNSEFSGGARRCVACFPTALAVIRSLRFVIDQGMSRLPWTKVKVILDDGSELGSCRRHELFGDN